MAASSRRRAGFDRAPCWRRRRARRLLRPTPFSDLFLDLAGGMIEILLVVARHEIALGRRRHLGTLHHRVLEQHVHEQVHRLGLDDQGAGRLAGAGIEVLVDAIVVHDGDVAGLPVVAHAIVDLVAGTVENVERRLVDMAVLLGSAARRIFLEMDVQRLAQAVLGLDIVAAEMLRAAVELGFLAFDHPRLGAQALELVGEAISTGDGTNEDPFLVRVVLALTHISSCSACVALAPNAPDGSRYRGSTYSISGFDPGLLPDRGTSARPASV